MTTSTPLSYSDLTEGSPGNEDEESIGHGLPPHVEQSCYRSGLMDFSSPGEKPRRDTQFEHRYTATDLAKAVDDARCVAALEVETALRAAFASDIEQRRCDLLAAIKGQLEAQNVAFEEALDRLACVGQHLAIALAKAVIPRAIEKQPVVDIREAFKAALVRLANEPTIEVRLPTDLAETQGTFLASLAKEAGFTGEIVTVADPKLGPGDAELRWEGGAIDRRLDRLQAEACGLVDQWLEGHSEATAEDGASISAPSQPDPPDDPSEQAMSVRPANERVQS